MINYTHYTPDEIADFLELEQRQPEHESKLMQQLISVQNKISILKNIESIDLKAIIYDLEFLRYKQADRIIKEGELSETIYFILSGSATVSVKKQRLGEIRKGESFGESAAIFGTKRNATVTAKSETLTLLSFKIDHNNFEFCAQALALMYKNLAFQINLKLEEANRRLLN